MNKDARKAVRSPRPAPKKPDPFTREERDAMRARAREVEPARAGALEGEAAVLAAIAELSEADRALAEPLHATIASAAPELSPRTWYGMPAYAREGQVVCFFQPARRFKTRYATLGFSDRAKLDEGDMWPTAFALRRWTAAEERRIRALLARALGRS